MKNKNATKANSSSALNNQNDNNKKNIKAVKKLRVLLHILYNPQGVSEKSINEAAHVMSGRNYPTNLRKQFGIKLVNPVVRIKDTEGCPYSLYQLLDAEQARKLVALIINHCKHYKLTCPDELGLMVLADRFPNRNKVAA